jgi:hypothetical protein
MIPASGSPGTSASGRTALILPAVLPPIEGDDTSPEGTGGFGGAGPLGVLAVFAIGVAGIELIAFAIRRELRLRKRSATAESKH